MVEEEIEKKKSRSDEGLSKKEKKKKRSKEESEDSKDKESPDVKGQTLESLEGEEPVAEAPCSLQRDASEEVRT